MNVRKMKIRKRAVFQAVNERDGWFESPDLVSRVGDILEGRSSLGIVGAYLSQLFEDGYLIREKIATSHSSYRYKYHKRGGENLWDVTYTDT